MKAFPSGLPSSRRKRARRDPSAELALLFDEAIRAARKGERRTDLGLVLWDATVEKTGPLRLVSGAQADMARRLGLTKVTKASAKKVWEAGLPLVFIGSNVNDYHFFGGWNLAYIPHVRAGTSFESVFNSFNFYLEPENGRPVTFIFGLPPQRRARR